MEAFTVTLVSGHSVQRATEGIPSSRRACFHGKAAAAASAALVLAARPCCVGWRLLLRGCRKTGVQLRAQRVKKDKKVPGTEFQPIEDYKRVKNDTIGSWGLLGDGEFATRMFACIVLSFVPAVSLTSAVFPPTSEEGTVLVQNIAASFLFAVSVSTAFTACVLMRVGSLWSSVEKALSRKSYIVEDSREQRSQREGGYSRVGSYNKVKSKKELERDQLLDKYEVAPAMARVRAYLPGSALLAVASLGAGITAGGEVRQGKPVEEDVNGCGVGCVPGLKAPEPESGVLRPGAPKTSRFK